MKNLIFSCLFILSCVSLSKSQTALEQRIAITLENTTVQEVLDTIENIADVSFAYDRRKLPMQKVVSIQFQNQSLDIILDTLFLNSGVAYAAADKQISLFRLRWPTYTLYGQIKDGINGEALIGANVFETINYQGASSNLDGYYSLTLPEGQYILFTSYIGFEDRVDTVNLFDDLYFDLPLEPGQELTEVLVIDKLVKQEAIAAIRRSSRTEEIVDPNHAKSLPTSSGESDPLAIVRLLPGFIAGGSNRQNAYVRGGNADQNLVLLDGVPLYHTSRSTGNFSIFNGAAINEIKAYTSNIPAQYGDRLSSVIDVKTREGNDQEFHGGAMIGLGSGSLHAEGPLVKNKSSFLLAGRRSWTDIIIGQFDELQGSKFSFYDINAKLNYRLTNRDRIHASFYRGKDQVKTNIVRISNPSNSDRTELKQRIRWDNTAAAIRWHRKINPRLFSNFSAHLAHFEHQNRDETLIFENNTSYKESEFNYSSLVREGRVLADAVYAPSVKHQVNFGGQFTWRTADPGSISNFSIGINDTLFQEDEIEKISTREAAIFVEEEFQLNNHWYFRGGLRLSYLSVQGKRYLMPQLRGNIRYAFNDNNKIELSFDQTVQFMHLLSVAGSAIENEKWLPSTREVKPSSANQVSINYITTSDKWKMKIGSYYKESNDLLFFDQNESAFDSYNNWEEQITSGSGEAYGIEFLLAKLNGKTNGWLSYTWSKSTLGFPLLNNGNRFPHRYDRRHKFNIALTHSIKPKPLKQRYFGIIWTLATGHWTTVPSDYTIDPISSIRKPVFNEVNNAQLPSFHQLSISFNKDRRTSKGNMATWRYGIQNFYLRNNPDQVGYRFNENTDRYEIRPNLGVGAPTIFVSFTYTF